jgi:hypothetical protein
MMRAVWSALIVLLIEAFPAPAFAQSPAVCHAIRRGESAAQVARRTTGNGRNAYQTWFQIMNASSRVVPKSQYDRIHAGWTACVVPITQRLSPNANQSAPREAVDPFEIPQGSGVPQLLEARTTLASAGADDVRAVDATANGADRDGVAIDARDRLLPAAAELFRALGGVNLRMLWLGAAMVVPWLGWRIVDDYLDRRKRAAIVVQYFVHRFVDEFERPLVRYDVAEHPVRSRFRCGARLKRFEILLAPGEGRCYPNLLDHKKNVEYDVARVMRVLGDDSFVSGAPYAQAGWTVVPFQFRAGARPSGVTCISSL